MNLTEWYPPHIKPVRKAYNEDDAIDEAYSMIDRKEVEFEEWEVDDVSVEYPDND